MPLPKLAIKRTKRERPKRYFKLLLRGMRSLHGWTKWEMGEWEHLDYRNPQLCQHGFHCSKNFADALYYIQAGTIVAIVEVKDAMDEGEDKMAWQSMRVVRAYRFNAKDVARLAKWLQKRQGWFTYMPKAKSRGSWVARITSWTRAHPDMQEKVNRWIVRNLEEIKP